MANGQSQFVGITDKKIDPKSGSIQSFDNTSHETAAERDTNTLKEHRPAPPNMGGKHGMKRTLGN